MTKKEKLEQQKRQAIYDIVHKWRDILMLNSWRIDCYFMDKACDLDTDTSEAYATISVLPEYMKASIKFYPSIFEKDEEQQTTAIVHELCHCITQESWDLIHDLRNGQLVTPNNARIVMERLTQTISNLVVQGNFRGCNK